MDEDSDQSSEATHFEIITRQPNHHVNKNGDVYEESSTPNENEFDDDDDDQRDVNDFENSPMEIEEDFRLCQSETLASGLAEVPIQYEMRQDELEHLKNQLQGSHHEALAIVIAQAAQAHPGSKIQLPKVPSSCSELSPPISSSARLYSQREALSVEHPVDIHTPVANQKNPSETKSVSTSRTVKTPIDGFNWRKYGQKQVKSPQGSRSYFKCTYNECKCKKIESCDQYNTITKIVYKGQHEHEPPKKTLTRGDKMSSPSSRGKERKSRSKSGYKQLKSSGFISNGQIIVEEIDAPPPKQRVKKSSLLSPATVPKSPKPKFVIHAASDVGISADGYRWRKYGQKMVKGNHHPRNYYKCTFTGCPVRKHIEMAVDGSSEVILTYTGIHDHDMPIRTKEQGSPTLLLLTDVSSTKNTSQSKLSKIEPSNVVAEN